MLDEVVDVKTLSRKELNKPNISQKPEFIFACESDQNLSSRLAKKPV